MKLLSTDNSRDVFITFLHLFYNFYFFIFYKYFLYFIFVLPRLRSFICSLFFLFFFKYFFFFYLVIHLFIFSLLLALAILVFLSCVSYLLTCNCPIARSHLRPHVQKPFLDVTLAKPIHLPTFRAQRKYKSEHAPRDKVHKYQDVTDTPFNLKVALSV